jgi:hypothetical protein
VEVKIPGKLIFKCIVGSQAYGTTVEGSDIDLKGVYIQNKQDILGFDYKPQIEVGKDEVYYEVRRFIELLATANPTVLEMLYNPEDCVLICTKEFDLIRSQRDKFLTKKCLNSFGGYAIQQIHKARGLNKKMNWEKEQIVRKTPIDFCYIFARDGFDYTLVDYLKEYHMNQALCGLTNLEHFRDCYKLYYDLDCDRGGEPIGLKGIQLDDSNSIRVSAVPKNFKVEGLVYYNKDAYTQHCKAYKEYQVWLKERNVQRYIDIEGHGQKIDGKNMLHCCRLLDVAAEIPVEHTINVRRPNAQELIAIRKGKVNLETILEQAESDIKKLDELYKNSDLPKEVSQEFCNQLLLEVRYV